MKKNFKITSMTFLKKVVYQTAEKNANSACPTWLYQEKLPAKVQKLRKF